MNNDFYINAEMAAQDIASDCAMLRAYKIASVKCFATTEWQHKKLARNLERLADVLGYTLTPKETKE
jgi:hypothetical protein